MGGEKKRGKDGMERWRVEGGGVKEELCRVIR